MSDSETLAQETEPPTEKKPWVYRHRISTRLWHWTNVVVLLIMLMSGLMIFNAHPMLYWGSYGANYDPSWLEIGSQNQQGYLRVGDATINTTGVLGRWENSAGGTSTRAFPSWATIPANYNLAEARRWHLTFAWFFAGGIVLYELWSLFNGHLRRDLAPKPKELKPRNLFVSILHHATFRFPKGEAARDYNILQKMSYLGVLCLLLPVMILTGLTMSPMMSAAWPWLLDLFGGRQSARSIHFITATLLVLFVLVHLAMVVLAGPINEIRSMITGRYRLPQEKK